MAVAGIAIEVDARRALQQLKAVNQQALATAGGLQKLSADALKVKSAVEAQQGGFAKASQVQGVFAANVKNTEAAIRAQINALRDVQSRTQIGGALYQKAASQIAQYQSILDKANKTSEQSARSAGNLIAGIGKLAVAYVGLRTAQEAVQAGIQREESGRRLQFLAKGYGEVAAAQDAATRAGRQFGLSATESNQQFAQLYGRLRPLNVSLSDIEAAFVGFNTSAKVSGATAAESAGALLQLTQALGSGVLRGQELNSVLEQAPGLVVALTKELNAPVGQIRKLAEEGKITSEVVIRALKGAATEGADELAAAMDGPAQAVKNLQNEFENLQVAATKDLLPSIIDGVRVLTNTLKAIAPIIRGIGAVAGPVINFLNSLIEKATGLERVRFRSTMMQKAGAARLERAGVGRTYSDAQGNVYSTITGRLVQAAKPAAALAPPAAMPSLGASSRAGGGSAGDKAAQKAAEAAAKEAQRVAEIIRDRSAETELIGLKATLQGNINAAEVSGDKMLVARLQGLEREIAIQMQYAQLLVNEKNTRAQQAIIDEGRAALLANQLTTEQQLANVQRQSDQDRLNALKQHLEKQYEMNSAVQNQLKLADGISITLGQGLTSAFDALIQGSNDWGKSLQQIASGVLIDIANQLIRIFVIEQAINSIKTFLTPFSSATPLGAGGGMTGKFGTLGPNFGIPQRAMGGSVTAGQPYLVGERGPELFMPGRSGGIAPAGSFGGIGNIVVNVDASGTTAGGDSSKAGQLGKVVAAAVQAELIKQRRPGGILT